jgi:hypothetical protein
MPQNAAPAAMVIAGGRQKLLGTSTKDKVHRPGSLSYGKTRLMSSVYQDQVKVFGLLTLVHLKNHSRGHGELNSGVEHQQLRH